MSSATLLRVCCAPHLVPAAAQAAITKEPLGGGGYKLGSQRGLGWKRPEGPPSSTPLPWVGTPPTLF